MAVANGPGPSSKVSATVRAAVAGALLMNPAAGGGQACAAAGRALTTERPVNATLIAAAPTIRRETIRRGATMPSPGHRIGRDDPGFTLARRQALRQGLSTQPRLFVSV